VFFWWHGTAILYGCCRGHWRLGRERSSILNVGNLARCVLLERHRQLLHTTDHWRLVNPGRTDTDRHKGHGCGRRERMNSALERDRTIRESGEVG
jgi:hypothetical protein